MRLNGKTAIVTGGASGFGAGIVAKFVAEGARVMIADINGDAARAMAAKTGPASVAQTTDVSDGASVQAMADADHDLALIGHAVSLCLARAIARAICHARPAPGDTLPCWSDETPDPNDLRHVTTRHCGS